jgi:mRNA interferase HigB
LCLPNYPETKSALKEWYQKMKPAHVTLPLTHPNYKEWYQKMKTGQFQSIAELRTIFPNADKVGKLTVFNIGGNKIRLIAAIHYNRQKIYIREVLTHP